MSSAGAFDKDTQQYVHPVHAVKGTCYLCPDCGRGVFLRRGDVRRPHFAHYHDDVPCTYYQADRSESQIHKDGKLSLQYILEKAIHKRQKVEIIRNMQVVWCFSGDTEFNVVLEHPFIHSGHRRVADVALLDTKNGEKRLSAVFEVWHTHRTCEGDRPEPWFELNAQDIQQLVVKEPGECVRFTCHRKPTPNFALSNAISTTYLSILPTLSSDDDTADDTAETYRQLRREEQRKKSYTANKHEGILNQYQITYKEQNRVATIQHPVTGTVIRRSLVKNKTWVSGAWNPYLTIYDIVHWYKSPCGMFSNGTTMYSDKPLVRLLLNCPYAERQQVKDLGARWDPTVKKWHVPDNHQNREIFKQWAMN
jgi:hypothetical protein